MDSYSLLLTMIPQSLEHVYKFTLTYTYAVIICYIN